MKASDLFRDVLERDEDQELNADADYNAENDPDAGGLEALEESYEQYKEEISDIGLEHDRKLEIAEDIVGEIDFSNWDLNKLIDDLSKKDGFHDQDQGVFVSGAINELGEHKLPNRITKKLEDLSGMRGIGFRNTADLKIEGDVGYQVNSNEVSLLSNSESGTIVIEGNVYADLGRGMTGGTVIVKGDAEPYHGIPNSMHGGEVCVEGSASKIGTSMHDGFAQAEEGAKQAGSYMKGGEVGVKGSAEEVGQEMEGGILWTEESVEKAGYEAEGGTIYISGDVEKVGKNSEAGEIYVEGEISEIGENCGAEV